MDITTLETQLNDFDAATRQSALKDLAQAVENNQVELAEEKGWVNLHCHSFYSYNGYGLSPSALVWEAKKRGITCIGLVDFDVLDGVDEFHNAGRLLNVKTTAAMETRSFIPEFKEDEINSPGEPGVSYHMVSGFIKSAIENDEASVFADDLAARSRSRNLDLLSAVNEFLAPVVLDYDKDVLPLTPKGNATERHICEAYQRKGEEVFAAENERISFWAEKLDQDGDAIAAIINDPAKLQGLIRSKTMKRGGVGYQQPDENTFPKMTNMNTFGQQLQALPTLTWLDGLSSGEAKMEELLALEMESGVCVVNIVPDRNWNIADAETKAKKVAALNEFVALADKLELPIMVGTELNAPGLKFVDDFDSAELEPLFPSFKRGADIVFGHHVALALGEAGYNDPESIERFPARADRNAYFAELGQKHSALPSLVNA